MVLLLVAALLGGVPTAASAAPSTVDPAAAVAGSASPRVLTLITGDRITATGDTIRVEPRAGVQFLRFRQDGGTYVVPSDALGLLRLGRLDDRLFNVTRLVADGFDKRAELPLMVEDTKAVRGLTAGRPLPALDGFATRVPVAELARNWPSVRDGMLAGKIWLDGVRRPLLDVSVPRTGAPVAWSEGLDGTGVKVAVIDSGIDDTHPDLAGRVSLRKNFVQRYEGDNDIAGHGTHVASIVAGTGAASGGRYRGMAPAASLLDGKVCFYDPAYGGLCDDSAIIEAMYWAAENGAQVVNMSLGSPDEPGVDPIEAAVDDITARYGTLFVIAAGNLDFFSPYRVASPSTADAALSVANNTKAGAVDWSSLPGPRIADYAVKPEISAPGTEITAARSSTAGEGAYPTGEQGDPYVPLTGTSMASPHVAGAAAILTQAHPDWTAEQRKAALTGAARPMEASGFDAQGAGELDLARALHQPVTASPATVNVGFQAYPHTQRTVTRTITYTNRGGAPLTLALTAPSPLSLSASSVTVPAGGTSTVDVSMDLDLPGGSLLVNGRITATGGGVTVQTPYSVYREGPTATVNVKALDRKGNTPEQTFDLFVNAASGEVVRAQEATAALRLPYGTYFASSYIVGADGTSTVAAHTRLVVDRDRVDVVFDARKAKGLDLTVPERAAAPMDALIEVQQTQGPTPVIAGLSGDPRTLFTLDLGPKNVPGVVTQVLAAFARPDGPGGFAGSPFVYRLGWYWTGSWATGYTRHVQRRELATAHAVYHANAVGGTGLRADTAAPPGVQFRTELRLLADAPLPVGRTEYYAGNLPWEERFYESTVDAPWVTRLRGPSPQRRSGQSTVERWNRAVLDTTFASEYPEYPTVERKDDGFWLRVGNVADADGNFGTHDYTAASMSLYRNGTLVEERDGGFAVIATPQERARYTLRYSQQSDPALRLSTRRETVWEFTNAYTGTNTPVPLHTIGFAPNVDEHNTARAGCLTALPVTIAGQAGATAVTRVEVEVSFDGGVSWRRVPVVKLFGRWNAVIDHPARAGYVSLRAKAVDAAGSTVTTTLLNAYETR
ncbi:S8 family peptidase [Virgisporangium aliadipatigenens]|uniref:S8 family peptidase n=1 Tax=Virgisporangium aliadipatigenens TaxID=741659 RepID=UPI00194156F9|nr:S8 family serine peptidase [Virgisporangium aliadipatigenens]